LHCSDLLERLLEKQEIRAWLGTQDLTRPVRLPEGVGCAPALLTALLAATVDHDHVVVRCSSPTALEGLCRDLDAFGNETEVFRGIDLADDPTSLSLQDLASGLPELQRWAHAPPKWLCTTDDAWKQKLPDPPSLTARARILKPGLDVSPEQLVADLESEGYQAEALVVERGQYCRRAGLMDLFPVPADWPVRVEWFGDEIESLREFDPATQLSRGPVSETMIPLGSTNAEDWNASLMDFLPGKCLEIEVGGASPESEISLVPHPFTQRASVDHLLLENRRQWVLTELEDWQQQGVEVFLVSQNEGEEHRLFEWLGLPEIPAGMSSCLAPWVAGFIWPEARLVVLCDAEIFGRYHRRRPRRSSDRLSQWRSHSRSPSSPEFDPGDTVVHLEYGVARYLGLTELKTETGGTRPVLELEFSGGAKCYVPIEQAYLVSRYVGVGKRAPILDTLGNQRWKKKKSQAHEAVLDYAARLLETQAERSLEHGFAFPPDSPWQWEFEAAFPYQETQDQLKAIEETKGDMERPRPMDRLICGDVGFGKTEVAIRAAFKAVMAGKQVAFLAPTTVLSQQHFQTLTERMADYPVRIEIVSRLVSTARIRQVLRQTREGTVDILIGTHRLLSADVEFKDIGLVIVDEEQRFGVDDKERLKTRYRTVDFLTLSATPIPRTLYMALMGTRDMSTIDTPPRDRMPIDTVITGYDERLIRDAIHRELHRGGQVFFLHNRVKTIQRVARQLRFLLPDARVLVGHGQMHEQDLEEVMLAFVDGEADILVSTTIIESGIDIPNANTIIIDRADRFGLADLYQLRGRVGRSSTRAYALLLLPRDLLSGDAGKRVQTIRQYSQLGAGFKVAMRDLEIRGAGNLLGTAQSGHIAAVGFELYCRLLKQAIAQLRGEPVEAVRDVQVRLDFLEVGTSSRAGQVHAFIPNHYISDEPLRIQAYRDLAALQSRRDLDRLKAEWKDRFGRWPEPVEMLLGYNRLRLSALSGNITQITVKGQVLKITRNGDYITENGKFPRLKKTKPKAKLLELERWIQAFSAPPQPVSSS